MDYDKDELNGGGTEEPVSATGTEAIPVPETEIPPALETYSIDHHTDSDSLGAGEGQDDLIEEAADQMDSAAPAAGIQAEQQRPVEAGAPSQQGYTTNPAAAPGPQGYTTNPAAAPGQQDYTTNPAAAPSQQGYTANPAAPGQQGYATNPATTPGGQGYTANPAPSPGPQGYTTGPAASPGPQGYYSQHPQNYPVASPPQNNYVPAGGGQYPPAPEKNGMAIASLVMGILSLLCCCCGYAGIGFGALGIIFALLSRKEEPMCTHAKTGLILSIIGIAITVIVVIFFIFAEAASLFVGGIN